LLTHSEFVYLLLVFVRDSQVHQIGDSKQTTGTGSLLYIYNLKLLPWCV